MSVIIERLTVEDWQRVKAVRLRALADTPDAFASTLEMEAAFADQVWQDRLRGDSAATFMAVLDEQDAGLVTGAPFAEAGEGTAGLFAMWTAPEVRGRGVASALVRTVIDWARQSGYPSILLDVADDNRPAIALYERHGFRPTGRTGTLPPPRTHVREHQRRLEL